MTADGPPRKVMRVIARLNIGGPAIQAITLTHELEAFGYPTRLVRGVEDPAEGNMDYLALEQNVVPTLIPSMRRDPGIGDIPALLRIVLLLWRDRPAVVHTHAAKAGLLGRLATVLAFPVRRWRPVVVHTYHGHSLTGYFSSRTACVYRLIEKLLARVSDVLLAVSEEVRDDLVGLDVAPPAKFRVMPLGFDLSAFSGDRARAARRENLRSRWGVRDGELVVMLIARLVPIKRVDRFLSVARLLSDKGELRFVVVGDGELRSELAASDDAIALGSRLVWAGFSREVADACYASDVVMLTSDNEGTPVSLIEAQAAALPVVATAVGGVGSVVHDGEGGFIRDADDVVGLANAAQELLEDSELRTRMGAAGRERVTGLFTLERLTADHRTLYDELLSSARAR